MRQTRNVSLPQELDRFVSELLHSGRYQSASEVMREALRLLQEREQARSPANQVHFPPGQEEVRQ